MGTERTTGRRRRHVVVVGGGISGLAAAYGLATAPGGPRVTVLEQSARLGGKLDVVDVEGVPVDQGAESVLARRPEALDLVRAAGLGADLVHPATTTAAVWSRGALRPLPPGTLMGVPTSLRTLAASGLLSRRGLARVALDRVLPATRLVADRDVPIGWYVTARLGHEVTERLVEPLLGGVYAGRSAELSLGATVPALAEPVRRARSLLAAASRARAGAPPAAADAPVFGSVAGGLGRLPSAVARASGAEIRTSCTVRALRRTERGWSLVTGSAHAPELLEADAVVLAVPAAAAARLLDGVVPSAASALGGVVTASMATVTLVFDRAPDPAPAGSGFLVPPVEGRLVKAATYLSQKWAWVGDAADGRFVVRCSVGRRGDVRALQRDPERLALTVGADLAELVGTPVRPRAWAVRKWGGGLPQYAVGHLDRVRDVRAAVAEVPGLAVCGATYDGVGVAACVASARTATDQVLAMLAAQDTMADDD